MSAKPKMAQIISAYVCEHCSSVHIGLFRNGRLFAEAIPHDPQAFAADLAKAIAESREVDSAPASRKH